MEEESNLYKTYKRIHGLVVLLERNIDAIS